jgi:carboxymethylenebutenolidase
MKKALAAGHSKLQCIADPEAGHAWHADCRASYVAVDAKDGLAHCLAWFQSHGVA